MKRAYGLLPWGIIVLGVLHMAATWRFYDHLTPAALWFFNGGIVLIFTGALNLINRRHSAEVPALRWFCRGVNVVTMCFATISGLVGGASVIELIVVIGMMGTVTVLSFMRTASATLAAV
jgi:hypothetical protein